MTYTTRHCSGSRKKGRRGHLDRPSTRAIMSHQAPLERITQYTRNLDASNADHRTGMNPSVGR